jgi:hypothetical protein
MAQRHNGTMAQPHTGTVAQRHNRTTLDMDQDLYEALDTIAFKTKASKKEIINGLLRWIVEQRKEIKRLSSKCNLKFTSEELDKFTIEDPEEEEIVLEELEID